MIKLRDLQYLDAIAEYCHFGKAAEACFVSQPTLSGQLMKLEEQLGLTLIERHRRNVMLTPAGEQLVKQGKLVLKAAEEFEAKAKALLDPLSGDMHVGLIPTLAPYLLPHIMSGVTERLPNVDFFLHEDQTKVLLKELDAGRLDMLILPWLSTMEGFERYDLFSEPLVLAMPPGHSLGAKEVVELSDLDGQPVLTLEDGHCLRDQAMDYCFSAGAEEDSRFRATSLETLRFMVANGLGITLLPQLAVSESSNMLLYRPFSEPQPSRNIALVIRPNYPRMECVREIVASVRQSIKGVLAPS
ncbi:LysR family hydrogen peroxide-inducible transcriptional activator [Sinobacterium caligoides]|uniref:LysR family hydrogen peroxide-inducible transcriptional activator n=1 Tax=Sinobacterium caligoides TaxID=933926 RepID=A0A3N2DZP8_9GAMM|nr:DNA-binding transcriptional regulator OxyR [Sinobacterium caligoides]ROS05308.1 LysR family hydrogen peroxide-inducible transcriptional activator [Sinobacterium caligoides]